jgi:hypothetical protein
VPIHTRHGADLRVTIINAHGGQRDKAAGDSGVDERKGRGKGMDITPRHQATEHPTWRRSDKPNTKKKIKIIKVRIGIR